MQLKKKPTMKLGFVLSFSSLAALYEIESDPGEAVRPQSCSGLLGSWRHGVSRGKVSRAKSWAP